MFRTEINRMSEVWNEIKAQDAILINSIDGMEEKIRWCERAGFEWQGKEWKGIKDVLIEERRSLYELMLALNAIIRSYKKKEETLLDDIKGDRRREVRESGWISISFPEEMMELIGRIKVPKEQ